MPHIPTDPFGLLVYLIGLLFLWVVVSIPVYFAGRIVKGKEAAFGDAMGATLGGLVAYYLVSVVIGFFLGAVIGTSAGPVALAMGLIVWLGVFRSVFRTTWGGAVAIVVVAWALLMVLDFVLVVLFHTGFPAFYPF